MNGAPLEHGPARILIADDLPDLLQALVETLEREGFIVTPVDNGQSALDAIRADPPDIAVLDLKMPKLTGFQVCAALRADPLLENLPVIILSPSKFALCFTTGCMLTMAGFAQLRGWRQQLGHMTGLAHFGNRHAAGEQRLQGLR